MGTMAFTMLWGAHRATRSQVIVRASHTLLGKLELAITERGDPAGGRGWWRRRGTREEAPSLCHLLIALVPHSDSPWHSCEWTQLLGSVCLCWTSLLGPHACPNAAQSPDGSSGGVGIQCSLRVLGRGLDMQQGFREWSQ